MKMNSHSHDMTTAKFNRTAVQVPDAQAKIAARVTVGSIEKVHLESAHGRTLAETIQAPIRIHSSGDRVWMDSRLSVQIP